MLIYLMANNTYTIEVWEFGEDVENRKVEMVFFDEIVRTLDAYI